MLQSSMGKHKLDVRYGDRNTLPYYNGVLDTTILNNVNKGVIATAGKVMTLTTAKRLTVGLSVQGAVPYYSWSGLDANNYPDVDRVRGMPGYLDKPAAGIGAPGSPGWAGIPTGSVLAGGWATIQHIAAAELSSTAMLITPTTAAEWAFNGLVTPPATITAADYAPGTPLTVLCYNETTTPTTTDELASVGLLVPVNAAGGAAATSVVVGYVAPAGVFLGPEGYLTVAFTPAFVAGTTVPVLNAGALANGAAGVVIP
jgi:hypothetical protein